MTDVVNARTRWLAPALPRRLTGAFSNGKVTGGTGSFKGATGTITVKPISNIKAAVTVTYTV